MQEAFIEQRHSVGAVRGQVKLLDSLEIEPKLVIIPRQDARLQSLWVGDAFIQVPNPPYEYAGGVGGNIITLNLTKKQMRAKFTLLVQAKNERGQYQDYNLTVQPQPIVQKLVESYNSTLAQSRHDGVLLATCTLSPPSLTAGHFRLHIQEAFIEHRFRVGSLTHEVLRLDSGRVRPHLVLVGAPGTRLWPAGAAWTLTLTGGKLSGYQKKAGVLAFDLPERDLHRQFTLQLRIKNRQGGFESQSITVRPTAAPQESAAAETAAEPTSTLNQDGFEESFPVFNASADAARRAGMLRATCQATPTTVSVEDQFRLDIEQVFVEQPALRTGVTKRISLDTTMGPRLMLAYRSTSRLGELGIDWDMHLQDDARNLVYRIPQHQNMLAFRLASAAVPARLTLHLRVKNRLGVYEEHLIKLQSSTIAHRIAN